MHEFSADRYVPVLLAKRGERTAIQQLPSEVKERITPLLVAPPIDWDYDNGSPSKTVDQHLQDLPDALAESWGHAPAFIDLVHIDEESLASGEHPLSWVTRKAQEVGLALTPVVGPERSSAYKAAVADVVARDGASACVRLPMEEWTSGAGTSRLDGLISTLGLTADQCHLILDLGADLGPAARILVTTELHHLPYAQDWLSVTIVGTSMPQAMPTGRGVHQLVREEWNLYRELTGTASQLQRTPTFGDYAIAHSDPTVPVDPRLMNITATLRYTSGDSWLVARGDAFKASGGLSRGGSAIVSALEHLTQNPGYLGSQHCATEGWVESVLTNGSGGNPEVWRRQGTLHHLAVVTEQVANLVGT